MKSTHVYNRIASIPIFMGLSAKEMEGVIAHTRFGFLKLAAGKVIARSDSPCTQLIVPMNGEVSVASFFPSRGVRVEETLPTDIPLELERLYGLNQHYQRTYSAQTECHCLCISKDEINRLMQVYDIVRINVINHIATQHHRLSNQLCMPIPSQRRQRVLAFFRRYCLRPAGEKKIYVKMQQLADETGESRLNISRELHQMCHEGFLTMSRACVHIPALEKIEF